MFDFSYSILSCFKNKWDQVKRPENVWECVRYGVQATVSSLFTAFAVCVVTAQGLALVTNLKTGDRSYNLIEKVPLFDATIKIPIKEEFLFRFIIQNGIYGVQEALKEVLPSKIQKNRIFEWLASPGFRALSANAFFAIGHLSNAGGYLSSQEAAVQAVGLLTMPVFSIVFEKTRPALKVKGITELCKHALFPFIASCASHMVRNSIGVSIAVDPLAVIPCCLLILAAKKFAALPVPENIPHNSIKEIPEGCHFS